MKFLLDANLSPRLVAVLRDAGHEAMHVVDLGLVSASDEQIFERATTDEWIIVTADSDFSMLLALASRCESVGRASP